MEPVVTAIVGFVIVFIVWFFFNQNKKPKRPVALDPNNWQPFTLTEVETISHDVKKFRFSLPSKEHVLGLPIGQHISFKYVDENDREVIRSYTPASSDEDIGYVDFVVKIYFKNVHPKFPEGNVMNRSFPLS